jgi:3-hydroxybutyryl-CoA dehydrogenase
MTQINKIGVVGAGTMGKGIALATLLADLPVVLYDVSPNAREEARSYINSHLEKKHKAINMKYLRLSADLSDLAGCGAVIEAAPEDLGLKKELFSRLGQICPPPAILATNTSTLSVTAIAASAASPERVVGMHFFNPAPVLPLVEVVRAAQTSDPTLSTAVQLAERMGKVAVIARDTPGFIVNRVARPFYSEALHLLGEGTASVEQIDRIVREGGSFKMGPFELMDLIGIDVNLAATRSIYEQTFYEPRYRPHPIQAQMAAQGNLGRKTGRGFYDYTREKSAAQNAPETHSVALHNSLTPILMVPGCWERGLRALAEEKGLTITEEITAPIGMAIITAGRTEGLREHLQKLDGALDPEVPLLSQCLDTALGEIASWLGHPERLIGFDSLFFGCGKVATLAATRLTDSKARIKAEAFAAALGRQVVWIEETPGMVLPRLIACLANEAAFAVGEGVATAETIDQAMQLGTNYPRGPLAWAEEIGYAQIVAILEHLHAEYGEERYRVAPRLRQWARLSSGMDNAGW